jgi:hypothetical protein
MILAAKIWHYWVAFPLVGSAVLATLSLGVGYLVKVVSNRYPRQ